MLNALRIDRAVALNDEADLGGQRDRSIEPKRDEASGARCCPCTTDMETRCPWCRRWRRRRPSRRSGHHPRPAAVVGGVAAFVSAALASRRRAPSSASLRPSAAPGPWFAAPSAFVDGSGGVGAGGVGCGWSCTTPTARSPAGAAMSCDLIHRRRRRRRAGRRNTNAAMSPPCRSTDTIDAAGQVAVPSRARPR